MLKLYYKSLHLHAFLELHSTRPIVGFGALAFADKLILFDLAMMARWKDCKVGCSAWARMLSAMMSEAS